VNTPGQDPVRVVVVDDQTLVREGFALLLGRLPDVEVVATAADGLAALAVVAATSPEVVLMDLRMPGLDGAETTERIRDRHPTVAVLLLTTYLHDAAVLPALRAGALGAIGKDAAPEEVAAAVRAVRAGIPVLPTSAQRGLLADATAPRPAAGDPTVSPREVEVLRLIAEGLANPQIAQRLAISVPTVKTHVNNLFAKLAVPDRAAAVATAAARGLLS